MAAAVVFVLSDFFPLLLFFFSASALTCVYLPGLDCVACRVVVDNQSHENVTLIKVSPET